MLRILYRNSKDHFIFTTNGGAWWILPDIRSNLGQVRKDTVCRCLQSAHRSRSKATLPQVRDVLIFERVLNIFWGHNVVRDMLSIFIYLLDVSYAFIFFKIPSPRACGVRRLPRPVVTCSDLRDVQQGHAASRAQLTDVC